VSRRTRTLEILTAANLLPQQLAVEQARGARDARVAQALASLVPATISAGTGALGKLADYQAEQDLLALKRDDLTAKSATDKAAAAAATARAEALKVKAEADKVKATTDASEATRKASEAAAKDRRQNAMDLIEGGAGSAAALLPTGGDRRVVGTFRPGESPLDEIERIQADSGMGLDQLAGLVDKQGLATRKAAADLKLAERKATAPLTVGPKPKTPEQIQDAEDRRKLTKLSIAEKEAALRGDKPMAPSDNERKVQNDVDSLTDNIAKLEGDIGSVNASGLEPGLIAGPARAAYATVFGDEKWTDFESTRDAVNLQIFGTLRSDAPSEEENKQAAKLKIGQSDNLETIRAKLRTIKALLDAKRRKPGSRLDELIIDLRGAPKTTPRPAGAAKPASEMTEEEIMAELAGGG
jgi:hypothetical protein